MSLDSILENPSLKNLILNNSVSDYEGFLTGMSSNNFLEVFGPSELNQGIQNLEKTKPASEVKKLKKKLQLIKQ